MTFEDVKRIRENPTAEDVDNQELHKTIDLAIEKQIPKKPPKDQYGFYVCPSCGADDYALMHDNNIADRYNHCHNCGQALDWGDCE